MDHERKERRDTKKTPRGGHQAFGEERETRHEIKLEKPSMRVFLGVSD